MGNVPTSNLTALYTNTTPGTTADPAAVDAAIIDIVATVNGNSDFVNGLISSDVLSELGVINVKDYNASGLATTATGSITTGTKLLTFTTTPDFVAGQGINLQGVKEVASLQITAPASASANCTVTLNGVAFTVALTSGATAVACATAIRAATFTGWTAGGTALSDTVTFTSLTTGTKTDASYSAGTTGATGTMSTTTQGTADQISTVSSINGLVVNIADNATRTITAGTILHDDTVAFQTAISALATAGGGKLIVPEGMYYINGTLTHKKNVVIEGTSQFNASTVVGVSQGTTILLHNPSVTGTDLFIADAPQAYGYLGGMGIHNLNIQGNANSRYAIKLDKAGDCIINNVAINGGYFVDGIVCDYWIHSTISNCYITGCSNSSIRFTGGVSTTTVLEKCYMRGSAWGFIAEVDTCLGVTLNTPIVETCVEGGYNIHCGNVINVNNPYTENVPSTNTAKPIFAIGKTGVSTGVTIVTVNGGAVAGCNFGINAGSSIFDCDKVTHLSATGTYFTRAANLINTTTNSKQATFLGISTVSITSRTAGIFSRSKVCFLSWNDLGTTKNQLDVSRINFVEINKWRVEEVAVQTTADILWTYNAATFPFMMDGNGNMRYNFIGASGLAANVSLWGAVTAPDYTGAASTQAGMWAETISTVTRMRTHTGNGRFADVGRITAVPGSASGIGLAGDIAIDSDYIYCCIATNTWKRVAISTW